MDAYEVEVELPTLMKILLDLCHWVIVLNLSVFVFSLLLFEKFVIDELFITI